MPAQRPIHNNFTAGELSPRMFARVDLDQYKVGAAEILNLMVLPQGGVTRRSGTYYVANTKANAAARLIRFVASDKSAYVLILGDYNMRIIKNRGLMMNGGAALEFATPWPASVLREIDFSQSADVMFLTHGSYAPRKLSRTAVDVFSLETAVFEGGPWGTENTGDTGYAPSDTSSSGGSSGGGTVSGGDTNGGNGGGGEGGNSSSTGGSGEGSGDSGSNGGEGEGSGDSGSNGGEGEGGDGGDGGGE